MTHFLKRKEGSTADRQLSMVLPSEERGESEAPLPHSHLTT
jgi:hypothetical protein